MKSVYETSELHSTHTNPGIRLNKLKSIAQELLEGESADVKKQVDDEIVKWREDKAMSLKILESDPLKKLTPQEYQMYVIIYS